jgi:hypothetical protein
VELVDKTAFVHQRFSQMNDPVAILQKRWKKLKTYKLNHLYSSTAQKDSSPLNIPA